MTGPKPEPLKIPAAALDAMALRAELDYPEETCGLLFRTASAVEVVPLRNVQNDLHRADPAAHPRGARTAYAFDPGELSSAMAGREDQGAEMIGIYHSHPDHDAYFSATDRREAAPTEWGEPAYPGVTYFVLSVYDRKLKAVAAFAWDEEERDFVEVGIEREG